MSIRACCVTILALLLPHAADAQTTVDCTRPLVIDVAARSVVGIGMNAADSVIEERARGAHLRTTPADTSTARNASFTLDVCGHAVRVGWNGFIVTDTAFVTTEGLRVGMPVDRFDAAWGEAQLLWSESGWVAYYFVHGVHVNLGLDGCVSFPAPPAKPRLDHRCRTNELWVGTPERVMPLSGPTGTRPGITSRSRYIHMY